jgi:hypothetical protein
MLGDDDVDDVVHSILMLHVAAGAHHPMNGPIGSLARL